MSTVPIHKVIDLFETVLEGGSLDADSNFFTAGGDSLLATRVIGKVAREFDVELTFAEFSQAPTPSELQALINEQLASDAR
ncbi:phosphopantetheine-binding protein [Kitasatospora sp. NPDC053057]|uniref:phosphopantetheine-binding protein n=1 Tax=Kitasatospora sp. NPDC053057 TaxID=3364062 RepID=UPI0037C55E38